MDFTISDILEELHNAAINSILDDPSSEIKGVVQEQKEAIDIVGDFVANNAEKLDDTFDIPKNPDEADLYILRNMKIKHDLHDAMILIIEMACQQYDERLPNAKELNYVIDASAEFWMKNASSICGNVVSFDVSRFFRFPEGVE